MTQRTRKFIGTVVLLVFLTLYVIVAGAIGSGRVLDSAWWVQMAYFVIAGLAWVPPAGLLVRWMARPDTAV